MGKIETIVLEYLSNPEVFADLFNGYIFDGEQLILPENLQEVENDTQILISDGVDRNKKITYETLKKKRDIVREVVLGEQRIRLAVLGVEHQSEIDYSMVLRTQAYDIMEYLKQAKEIQRRHKRIKDLKGKEYISGFKREDRLIPTITIVFYTGEEKWDAAISLKELYEESPFLEKMLPYMPEVPLNLLSIFDVKNPERYHGSLRAVFELLKYADDGSGMLSFVEQNQETYSKLDEVTRRLVSMLVQLDIPETEEWEEEEINMCKALEDIKQIGREEGREIGLAEGKAESETGIIQTMLSKGITDEAIASMTDIPLERVRQVAANTL